MVETQVPPITGNPQSHAGFWRHPRRVWLRRALFQIHLWVGLLICLYCVVIGFSGSLLVFEDELGEWSHPAWMSAPPKGAEVVTADAFAGILSEVERKYPQWQVSTIYAPGVRGHNYAVLLAKGAKYHYAYASAHDERLLGEENLDAGWINWIADLHFRLLAGSTGLIVNGVGAAGLLLLCITGAVIWWPGVKTWKRALSVDVRRRWKRINFDLHSALGFWTLAILSVWAISGVYFVWPSQFVAAVSVLSKASNVSPPAIHLCPYTLPTLPVAILIDKAAITQPTSRLQGFTKASADQPAVVMLTHSDTSEFLHTTWIYLDPVTGKIVGEWHAGRNQTAGDWFVWLMAPLHFGTYWGMSIKVLWALLGVALPVLSVTGVLMYWNRYLSKKWHTTRG